MQNSFTGLNNLCDQVIKTMKLPGRDMPLWLIIILDVGGVTKAYFNSKERSLGNTDSLNLISPNHQWIRREAALFAAYQLFLDKLKKKQRMHAFFSLPNDGIMKEFHKIIIHKIFIKRETHNHPSDITARKSPKLDGSVRFWWHQWHTASNTQQKYRNKNESCVWKQISWT